MGWTGTVIRPDALDTFIELAAEIRRLKESAAAAAIRAELSG